MNITNQSSLAKSARRKPWQQWTDEEHAAIIHEVNEREQKTRAMKKAINQTAKNAEKMAAETNPYVRSHSIK
jgi:predicted Fe-S protein YdhL (DUF1289 family)